MVSDGDFRCNLDDLTDNEPEKKYLWLYSIR